MFDIGKLFNINAEDIVFNVKFKDKYKKNYFECKNFKNDNDSFLKQIISFFVYYKNKYNNFPLKIVIINNDFYDKLAVVILEFIVYYVLKEYKMNIDFELRFGKSGIKTYELDFSPLKICNDRNKYISDFEKSDLKNNYINGQIISSHYRKIIKYDDVCNDVDFDSKIMTDLNCYFENSNITNIKSEELSRMVFELIDNAGEHGLSDVLIDIDITEPKFYKAGNINNDLFYGINIVVISISDLFFLIY